MTERVSRAIDVFLDALNNKTLLAGNPCGCAVGNLVAHSMGISLTFEKLMGKSMLMNDGWFNYSWSCENPSRIKDNSFSRSTEFTLDELAQIEKVFEKTSQINEVQIKRNEVSDEDIRKDQIQALEAVIKVMLEFEESKEDVKEVFTKRADLIPV